MKTGLGLIYTAVLLALSGLAATQAQSVDTRSGRNQAETSVIGFEADPSRNLSHGAAVTRQYADVAGGVFFDKNAAAVLVQECGREIDRDTACLSPAAEGRHAAWAGREMSRVFIDLGAPAAGASIAVAPQFASANSQAVTFELYGYANGDTAASDRAVWSPDARIDPATGQAGWVTLSLGPAPGAPAGARFERFSVHARDAAGNPAGGFLIDALGIRQADARPPFESMGPVTGFMSVVADSDPIDLARAEIIQERATPRNNLYPVAERRRTEIDWNGVVRTARDQRAFTRSRTPLRLDRGGFENVAVPVLAPLGAFTNNRVPQGLRAGALLVPNRDFYHLSLDTEHGALVIQGTRLITVPDYPASLSGTLEIGDSFDGVAASFALHGASYAVRLSCTGRPGERCKDPDALRDLINRLFVFIGGEDS